MYEYQRVRLDSKIGMCKTNNTRTFLKTDPFFKLILTSLSQSDI